MTRALEVGCATGRTTFELATGYDDVIGIDVSDKFSGSCQQTKEGRSSAL